MTLFLDQYPWGNQGKSYVSQLFLTNSSAEIHRNIKAKKIDVNPHRIHRAGPPLND